MKEEQKIILFSAAGGTVFWVIITLFDSLMFSNGPSGNSVLPQVMHDLFKRFLFLPVFIFFGVLLSGFFTKRRRLAFDRDIAERKAVEKALKESEAKYRSVMESVGDSLYLVDSACRYLFMNKKHLARLGLAGDGYIGRAYGDFHSPGETKEMSDNVETVLKTGESIQYEHLSLRDNRYFLRTLSPAKDSDGHIWAVTVVSKDVNDLKQLEQKLRSLSLTDELTGLYNRRGFFAMVEQVLKKAKREKRGVFLVYADLDNLKAVNDLLGHHEGDQVLVQTAAVLRATFRESDIIARIGGDEFVVIPMDSGEDNADIIKARFQKNLRRHNEKINFPFTLSISLGMAYYDPDTPCSVDELLRQAERLMYDDKCLRKKLKSN